MNKKKISEIEVKYSFECTNNINLVAYVYEGTEIASLEVKLKNNGTKNWPNNTTYLEFLSKSQVKGDKVILNPQKIGEEKIYDIKFKNLENLKDGEYESYVKLNVDGQNYGDELKLKIKIVQKPGSDDEMENYLDLIKKMRKIYALSEDDFSNEQLLKALKKSDFDVEQAFAELIILCENNVKKLKNKIAN